LLQYLLLDPLVDPPRVGFIIPAREVLEWRMHPEQIATPIRQPGLGKGNHQSLAEAGKGRGRRHRGSGHAEQRHEDTGLATVVLDRKSVVQGKKVACVASGAV